MEGEGPRAIRLTKASLVNFKQPACDTTGNEARESRKRHPDTAPSCSHSLKRVVARYQSYKVDCQLDSIPGVRAHAGASTAYSHPSTGIGIWTF